MGHNSAVLGHPISMSFPQVDGWLMDPGFWGVTAWYQSLGIRTPRAWWAWI